MLKDSGKRREFDSGAVRDIQEGKGRCDLLPLDVIGTWTHDVVFMKLERFKETGNVTYLYDILDARFKSYPMTLDVSRHFEEGALKYGENNWQKGIPVYCYIDSAVRHYIKWKMEIEDERHDRAFCWNILCAIWTCQHMPELNGYKHE